MVRSSLVRRGFTLAELLVVMVVLAALAALVIPRLGWVKDSADLVTSAAGSTEVANNIEIYKSATGMYPDRMDSLIKKDKSGIYSQFYGQSGPTAPTWLTMEAFDTSSSPHWYSLLRAGILNVMDHDDYTAQSDPSSSGTNLRDFQTSGEAAVVVTTGATGTRILNACGFNSVADLGTNKLVAFGIGGRSSLVGRTMSNVPKWSGNDQEFYSRYIAVFIAYDSGFGLGTKLASLRTVVDPRGFPADVQINRYKLTNPVND